MKSRNAVDLSIEFCGVQLKNPFLLASAPPTANGEMIARGFDAGWAGAVTKTLVLNASTVVNATPRFSAPRRQGAARQLAALQNFELVTDREFSVWLREIEKLRKSHPDHMLIPSIMADSERPEGWQALARQCQDAGAQMLELNLSCPHVSDQGLGSAIGQDPTLSQRVTSWVAEVVDIPVMPKMTPNVTDVADIAAVCMDGGADAIAAINTVAAISGVDLETMVPFPAVSGASAAGGLSGKAVRPIALKAVADIAQRTNAPVSGIGGVYSWEDAVEFLLLGASNVQICTAVMDLGFGVVDDLIVGLQNYLVKKELADVHALIGAALPKLVNPSELNTEIRRVAEIDAEKCVACGRCQTSCQDGGYQAISSGENSKRRVDQARCTGCGLCLLVCPVEGCIALRKAKSLVA